MQVENGQSLPPVKGKAMGPGRAKPTADSGRPMPSDRVDVTAEALGGKANSPAHVARSIMGTAGASAQSQDGGLPDGYKNFGHLVRDIAQGTYEAATPASASEDSEGETADPAGTSAPDAQETSTTTASQSPDRASGTADTASSGTTSEATATSDPPSSEETEPVTQTTGEVASGADALAGEGFSVDVEDPTTKLHDAMDPADNSA